MRLRYSLHRLKLRTLACCAAAIAATACETPPAQVNTAVPITWGEGGTLKLPPQSDMGANPWRKIVVLSRGVLTIGLQSPVNAGLVRLNVRSENGRRSIFQKDIELAPKSPVNVTLNVDAGTYFMVLEPLQEQLLNVAIAARFQPEDPDALSGPDKSREGAQVLVNAQAKEGAVSYRDSNRTDWYKYEVATSETLKFSFQTTEQTRGVRAVCITPTGLSFELTGQDKLVVREPGSIWIRVYAEQADSGGEYKISAESSPMVGSERKGIILKYNSNTATINMGTDDGVREGLKGYVQRPDGGLIDFVIEKALHRSSTARSKNNFAEVDLNLTVHFEKN